MHGPKEAFFSCFLASFRVERVVVAWYGHKSNNKAKQIPPNPQTKYQDLSHNWIHQASCHLLGFAQLGWLQKFPIYKVYPSRRSKRVRKNRPSLDVVERDMSPLRLPNVDGIVVETIAGFHWWACGHRRLVVCTGGAVHGPGRALAEQQLIRCRSHQVCKTWHHFASNITLPVLPLPTPPLKFTFPELAVRVQAIPALAQLVLASRTALDSLRDRQIMCCKLYCLHLAPAESSHRGSRSSTSKLFERPLYPGFPFRASHTQPWSHHSWVWWTSLSLSKCANYAI